MAQPIELQGRCLVAGQGQGEALVLAEPLSLWGGLDPETGEIIDRRHPASGQYVTGRVLVLPGGRGSSSASSILLEAIRTRTAPCAIIMLEADGILALGATVGREMYGRNPPVIVLAPDDYARIHDGAWVRVEDEGSVVIRSG